MNGDVGYRRVRRMAKHRMGSIVAVAVLSVLTAIALYGARDTEQYTGNLLLNIGASFLGAVVTYALINPLMSRADNRLEKILDHFDHATVIQRINDSKSIVRIFETGVTLLGDAYRDRFLAAIRDALDDGVKVELLILDPDCLAAEQRAAELGSALDVRKLISKNLQHLRALHDSLSQGAQPRFEVRVYDTTPLAAYYRWDQRAVISFFPIDRSSADTTQYETSVDSNFAQFVEQRFHESWMATSTYTMQQVFAIPVKIKANGSDLQALEADWVLHAGRVYLAHHELTSHALATGLPQIQVHLDHIEPYVGPHRVTLCDAESPVHRYFENKYGTGPKRTVFEAIAVDPA